VVLGICLTQDLACRAQRGWCTRYLCDEGTMEYVVWISLIFYLLCSIGALWRTTTRRPHIGFEDEVVIIAKWMFAPTLLATGVFAWSAGEPGLLRLLDANLWLATVYWCMLCMSYAFAPILAIGARFYEMCERPHELTFKWLRYVYSVLPLTSWVLLMATALLLGDQVERYLPYGSPDGIDYRLLDLRGLHLHR